MLLCYYVVATMSGLGSVARLGLVPGLKVGILSNLKLSHVIFHPPPYLSQQLIDQPPVRARKKND